MTPTRNHLTDWPEPRKVIVTGDSHADLNMMLCAIKTATLEGAPVVIQLGDFGYNPRTSKKSRTFLSELNRAAQQANVLVIWIDGNHEDHHKIATFPLTADGFGITASNIWHAPRGQRWKWGKRRFAALGGAISIDRATRTVHEDWFPEEAPTNADLNRLGTDPVDVLLTHDAPHAAMPAIDRKLGHIDIRLVLDDDLRRDCETSTEILQRAVETVKPRLVLHGHYHISLDQRIPISGLPDGRRTVRVRGLSSDGEWAAHRVGSLYVLTIGGLQLAPVTTVQHRTYMPNLRQAHAILGSRFGVGDDLRPVTHIKQVRG